MTDGDEPRKTRQRRARGSSSRAFVVSAALEVVDEVGIDRVSIRALARRAGIPPMSLYSHFSTKEELLDLMHAEMTRRFYPDKPYPSWQVGLTAVCIQTRQLLLAHPRWAALLSRPGRPVAIPLRERLLALMIADGMPLEQAFAGLASAVLFALGQALLDIDLQSAAGDSLVTQRIEKLKEWSNTSPTEGYPATHAALSKLGSFDLDRNFAFALRVYIVGLEAQRVRG